MLAAAAPILKRYHLEAQSADAFLVNQWWLDPATITAVLEEISSDYERSLDQMLAAVRKRRNA